MFNFLSFISQLKVSAASSCMTKLAISVLNLCQATSLLPMKLTIFRDVINDTFIVIGF